MPTIKLIADSGSTKTECCLLIGNIKDIIITQGMSPYFLDAGQVEQIIRTEVFPHLKKNNIDEIYFYGTGCKNPDNIKMFQKVFKNIFAHTKVFIDKDL